MKDFILDGSDSTPHFRLFSDGRLHFGGVSKPTDAASFYFNIMDWISDYYRNPNSQTVITISFSYLSSSSASMILKMFYCFNRMQRSGKSNVKCKWYYDASDAKMETLINQVMEYADLIDYTLYPSSNQEELKAS